MCTADGRRRVRQPCALSARRLRVARESAHIKPIESISKQLLVSSVPSSQSSNKTTRISELHTSAARHRHHQLLLLGAALCICATALRSADVELIIGCAATAAHRLDATHTIDSSRAAALNAATIRRLLELPTSTKGHKQNNEKRELARAANQQNARKYQISPPKVARQIQNYQTAKRPAPARQETTKPTGGFECRDDDCARAGLGAAAAIRPVECRIEEAANSTPDDRNSSWPPSDCHLVALPPPPPKPTDTTTKVSSHAAPPPTRSERSEAASGRPVADLLFSIPPTGRESPQTTSGRSSRTDSSHRQTADIHDNYTRSLPQHHKTQDAAAEQPQGAERGLNADGSRAQMMTDFDISRSSLSLSVTTANDIVMRNQLIELLAQFYAHVQSQQDKYESIRRKLLKLNDKNSTSKPSTEDTRSQQEQTPAVSQQQVGLILARLKMQLGLDNESLMRTLRENQDQYTLLKNFSLEIVDKIPDKTINVCDDVPKILILSNASDFVYCYTKDQWINKLWSDLHLAPSHYPMIILNILIFLFGTTGNIFVCLSVKRNHQLRNVTNYFIVNLAFADFLVILICLPATVIWDLSLTWFFGTIGCKLIMYLQDVSISVSVLTLTSISIDRYYAICHPFRFKSSLNQAKRMIALIWAISSLIMIPDLIYLSASPSHDLSEAGLDTVLYSDCNYHWSNDASRAFQFVKTIILYLIPFILMFLAHYRILRVLHLASSLIVQRDHQNHEATKYMIGGDDYTNVIGNDNGHVAIELDRRGRANLEEMTASTVIPLICQQLTTRCSAANSPNCPIERHSGPLKCQVNNVQRSISFTTAAEHGHALARSLEDNSVHSYSYASKPSNSTEHQLNDYSSHESDATFVARENISLGQEQPFENTPTTARSKIFLSSKKHLKKRLRPAIRVTSPSSPSSVSSSSCTHMNGGSDVVVVEGRSSPAASCEDKPDGKDGRQLSESQGTSIDVDRTMEPLELTPSETGAEMNIDEAVGVIAGESEHPSSERRVKILNKWLSMGDNGGASSTGKKSEMGVKSMKSLPTGIRLAPMGAIGRNKSMDLDQAQNVLILTMHNKNKLESRKKAAKMLTAIVILFGICYLPVHLINFLRQFIDDIPQTDITSTISMLSHCICYLNSSINPIIYNHMNSTFRAEFRKFLSCLHRKKPTNTTSTSTKRDVR